MSGKPFTISIEIAKKTFRLSAPVFSGDAAAPKAIANYFASLPDRKATLSIQEDQILLEETLPCSSGPQPTLRQQVYDFLRRARRCHHHLRCAANDERLGDIQSIL